MTRSAAIRRLAATALASLSLAACTNTVDRLQSLGEVPSLTKPGNPLEAANYSPVTTPTPAPVQVGRQNGSMWQPGARAFFKDQRATRVGDVLTVDINIDDSAKLDNRSQGSRGDSEKLGLSNVLGFEGQLSGFLPPGFKPATAINTSNAHTTDGRGQINRSEQIKLKVAALVTQVLPNGNLVITGSQEVRVNYDVRELNLSGIIRATDIDSLNTVPYEKIAEARISYGGRGQQSDLQQPRLGQQLLDAVLPF